MLYGLTYYDFENDHPYYKNVPLALLAARNLKPTSNTTTIHMYWHVPRAFGEKQEASLKSVITTQDLNKCKIVVWSNIDLSDNPHIKEMLPYIELRIYDPVAEAAGTPIDGWPGLTLTDSLSWIDSDIFRLLILYKYGGIYLDFDTITLRDLSPLYGEEFMAQFANTTITRYTNRLRSIAGGIMGMTAGSHLATELLKEIWAQEIITHNFTYGTHLYWKVRERFIKWYILPGAFFYPEWVLCKNAANFFKKCPSSTDSYDGAFIWHWHNQWDVVPEEGSKFWLLSQMAKSKFDVLKKQHETP